MPPRSLVIRERFGRAKEYAYYISLLLLISDDDVIVIGIVGNDKSKNNLEQKMIGSKIIDRVKFLYESKREDYRRTIYYSVRTSQGK